MANFYDDNEDLKFYVEKYIDWEPLVRLTEFDYRLAGGFENAEDALDFYKSVLDLVETSRPTRSLPTPPGSTGNTPSWRTGW